MGLESDSRRIARIVLEQQSIIMTDPKQFQEIQQACPSDPLRGMVRLFINNTFGSSIHPTRRRAQLEERTVEIFTNEVILSEVCEVAEKTLDLSNKNVYFKELLCRLGKGDLIRGIARKICIQRRVPEMEDIVVIHLTSL